MKIKSIQAREILDSRALPTVQATVVLEDGTAGKATVPSGASTGSREALELRDGDQERFAGKGVRKACDNIEKKIFPGLSDFSALDQEGIDQRMLELDGTENKSNLGANAILAVSLAVARAAAAAQNKPLWQHLQETFGFTSTPDYRFPIPMMNVINGGKHADSGLDLQEFMLVPHGLGTFSERIAAGAEIYQILKANLVKMGYRVAVGDEGGFAPSLGSNQEALEVIVEAINASRFELERQIKTGIDAAASEFYNKEAKQYDLKLDRVSLSSESMNTMYKEWVEKYKLALIEDPLSEFDWDGWEKFTEQMGEKITIIGDDLLVTNQKLVVEAIERKACNAVLIKVNQIGSLTETIQTVREAKYNDMKIAVSHRSGETIDDFIADLAVATEADFVKFGAPARGERVSKYNRVAEIEAERGASKF